MLSKSKSFSLAQADTVSDIVAVSLRLHTPFPRPSISTERSSGQARPSSPKARSATYTPSVWLSSVKGPMSSCSRILAH